MEFCLTYLPSGRAGNKVALGFSLSTLGEKDIEEYIVVFPFLRWESAFPKCYWIGQKSRVFLLRATANPNELSGQPITTGLSQLGSRELLLPAELYPPHLSPSRYSRAGMRPFENVVKTFVKNQTVNCMCFKCVCVCVNTDTIFTKPSPESILPNGSCKFTLN